jgi:hypothetical protein
VKENFSWYQQSQNIKHFDEVQKVPIFLFLTWLDTFDAYAPGKQGKKQENT